MKAICAKLVSAALCAVAVLTLTGCVYLRLLETKKQLGDFVNNFELEYEQATAFIILHPVLLKSDMIWLMESEPSVTKNAEGQDRWIYELGKAYQHTTEVEEVDYDIKLGMVFESGKLAQLWFPARFQTIMAEEVILGMFEDVKYGKDDEVNRKSKWEWYTGVPDFGKMETFLRVLGQPYERRISADRIHFEYAYHIRSASGEGDGVFGHVLHFVFHRETEKMISADIKIGRLQILIDTETGVELNL